MLLMYSPPLMRGDGNVGNCKLFIKFYPPLWVPVFSRHSSKCFTYVILYNIILNNEMDIVMSILQMIMKHIELKWFMHADFLEMKLGVNPGSQSPCLDHDHCSRETPVSWDQLLSKLPSPKSLFQVLISGGTQTKQCLLALKIVMMRQYWEHSHQGCDQVCVVKAHLCVFGSRLCHLHTFTQSVNWIFWASVMSNRKMGKTLLPHRIAVSLPRTPTYQSRGGWFFPHL